MTGIPLYLTHYANSNSSFPFCLEIHRIDVKFPAHRHDYMEFSYVIEGSGSEIINGLEHVMRPGTLTFISPYQVHEIRADKNASLHLYNCIFNMDLLFKTSEMGEITSIINIGEESLPPYHQFDDCEREQIMLLLEQMEKEYVQTEHWRDAMLRAKLTEILVWFDRARRKQNQVLTEKKKNEVLLRENIWEIIHYVHQHYRNDISLTQVAQQYHFSPSYLSELFKKHVGQNFVRFLHELRIRHACGLLTGSDASITEIASEVGYRSFQTFSRVFRELKDIPPSEYRKKKLLFY
ncbi:MAG: hypothetical protein A2189_09080 [Paenibacillus sp. RIFOXYA1_FULL_44_5]|nr:MAG: hypothetical protein A2189_09080 [Paenibacillus sp. RIFOXYA1_FULL_44_5]